MPADEKIDIEQLQVTVTKLLDKAGTDVRLTPRLLREKVEQRMKLEPDTLRPLKPKIMTMIVDWWKENHRIVVEIEPAIKRTPEPTELESLRNYVRAIEKSSHFFRNLKSLSDADQADNIRKRLRDEGFVFSDIPTVAEIEEEKRKYKIMEGMVYADRCIFLANEKLRHEKHVSSSSDDKTSEEDGSKSGKESNTSVVPPETDITERDMKKPKLSSEAGEDEEAEAQF